VLRLTAAAGRSRPKLEMKLQSVSSLAASLKFMDIHTIPNSVLPLRTWSLPFAIVFSCVTILSYQATLP
jgi:hypothetical protein